MRTRRLVSLMIALVAASIWVLATFSNASNDWDPVNFVLRVGAGTLTVAAGAEWFVLSIRESKREAARWDDEAVRSGDEDASRDDEDVPRDDEPVRSDDVRPVASPRERGVTRSAGSRTVLDNLLALFGRRRTAAQDLAVVSGGGAVLVVGYLMERKVHRVALRVGLDEASVQSLESALGAAPHRVFSMQTPTRGRFVRSAYTQIEGASRSGAWSIAIPTEDVDVFRYVLSRAEEIR